MIQWIHDFVNNKATFQYSIVSFIVMLAVSRYFVNANKAEFFAKLKEELGLKKDDKPK